MLTAPADLTDDTLTSLLASRLGLVVASPSYRPVGWGSHHWEAVDADGVRRFVTVDELDRTRRSDAEPLDVAFARLRAALAAAAAAHAAGCSFAVAPQPALDASPVVRTERFAVAVYPFVHGERFDWGPFPSDEHRDAVLGMLARLHATPVPDGTPVDDFGVPHRDALDAALAGEPAPGPPAGPFAGPAAELLAGHAGVRALLARYDALVAAARPSRPVLTHGEPHPGNTMLAADGWRLVDWDTALAAPPERDLWMFDDTTAYTEATGVEPDPALVELYRVRWDVADLAVDVDRFRRPHTGTPEDERSWHLLRRLIAALTHGVAGS